MTDDPDTTRIRCEATKLGKRWSRQRCKRNATTKVRGHHYCEQHAKIMVGMAANVRLDSRDAVSP